MADLLSILKNDAAVRAAVLDIAQGGTSTPAPTLGDLTIDPTSVTVGAAVTIAIAGATTGSTITGAAPAGMTLNSSAHTITGTPTTASKAPLMLMETLTGATGSPKQTSLALTVAAAAPTPPPLPAPTQDVLPALTTPGAAYGDVYSVERIVGGYAGPLAMLGNGAGVGGGTDVGAGKSGLTSADLPASPIGVMSLYSQTGSGRTISQGTVANRPRIRSDVSLGGRMAVLFPGHSGNAALQFYLTGGASGTADVYTDIFVMRPSTSRQRSLFAEYRQGQNDVDNWNVGGDANHGDISGNYMASQMQVFAIRFAGAAATVFRNGVAGATTQSHGNNPAAMDTGIFGSYLPNNDYASNMRLGAIIRVFAALNDADILAISNAMLARFGIPADYAVNIVHVGDSRTEAVQDTDTVSLVSQYAPLVNTRNLCWNLGIAGKSAAAMYATRADQIPALYQPGKKNIAIFDAGINDLNADNTHTGANTYSGAHAPMIGYLKGLGFTTLVATCLPAHTGNSYDDNAVNVQRVALNNLIVANAGGADGIIDQAADARIGTYPTSNDDATLFPDKIHQSTLAYSYAAPIYAAAINKVI